MAHAADTHDSHGTHDAAAAPESRLLSAVAFLATIAFTALLLWAFLSPPPIAAPLRTPTMLPPAATLPGTTTGQ